MRLPAFLSNLIDAVGSGPRRARGSVDVLRVVSVEVVGPRTALICDGAPGLSTVVVSALPSARRARALLRLMRVDRVEIEVDGPRVVASVAGVGHRLPTRRPVPVSVALGLIADGVRGRIVLAPETSGQQSDD